MKAAAERNTGAADRRDHTVGTPTAPETLDASTLRSCARLAAMQTAVAPTWLFRTADLSLVYPNGTAALSGLTVDVPRGSVGLVGANGAGKTTLFRLMLGLLFPTAGAIEVVGHVVAVDPIGIRSRLGYMPEHDCLPRDQSAADLVATFGELAGLPSRAARQRASDVLDLVGLDEARFRPVGGFSTGMRQRTKLAQALVADPELLLLDEPTAGLDPLGREEMLDLVKRLAGFGISVLFATHLLDDVQRVCDQVVMIDGGRLVLSGPIDELVERTGVVRVEVGGRPDAVAVLAAAVGRVGIACQAVDQHTLDVDTTTRGEEVFDVVRDLVADLGLRLYALSSRHRSLDDLFLQEAAHG
jgi:ABC-2 type transport system ATP-binding protein